MKVYPRWRFFLFLGILLVSGLYALPNLYPDDPAIQVTRSEAGEQVNAADLERLHSALTDAGIGVGGTDEVGDSRLIRVDNSENQLRARELAEQVLGRDYVVALNLAQNTPGWLKAIGASPMNLGLDLRGGVHFMLKVDMDTVLQQRLDSWTSELRLVLRDEGIRYRGVDHQDDAIIARFDNADDYAKADRKLSADFQEFSIRRVPSRNELHFTLTEETLKNIQDYAVDQNRTALNNRINELGVAEPVVQQQGADRIVVQLPGVQDASQARRILGRTATLEFRLVAHEIDPRNVSLGQNPPGAEVFPFKGDERDLQVLRRQKIVSGDQVTDAKMGFDENGRPEVNITLDSAGARNMKRITARNIKKPMAVLFIETHTDFEEVENEHGEIEEVAKSREEAYVINVATIQDALGSRFRITGLDSAAGAAELALLLRAGGLAAPMYIAEERTIGPSLGAQNIEAGLKSMVLGVGLVLIYMIFRYRLFGVVANVALLGNLLMLVGIMSLIPGATLTLPGIAGIVLSMGMAVDANVLIYERIRLELREGRTPLQAIEAGYDRAFETIFDANLTTLIVAVVLFAMGTGTVQGFAVTLFIGISASMFTAVVGTRSIISLIYDPRRRAPAKLSI